MVGERANATLYTLLICVREIGSQIAHSKWRRFNRIQRSGCGVYPNRTPVRKFTRGASSAAAHDFRLTDCAGRRCQFVAPRSTDWHGSGFIGRGSLRQASEMICPVRVDRSRREPDRLLGVGFSSHTRGFQDGSQEKETGGPSPRREEGRASPRRAQGRPPSGREEGRPSPRRAQGRPPSGREEGDQAPGGSQGREAPGREEGARAARSPACGGEKAPRRGDDRG